MMVEVKVGRCACGAMETVTYAQQLRRDEAGQMHEGWVALVCCPFCNRKRFVDAERITDFLMVLDTVETTDGGEDETDHDVLPNQPRG